MEIVTAGVYIRSLYLCSDRRLAIVSAHNSPSKGRGLPFLSESMNDFVCFEVDLVVLMATGVSLAYFFWKMNITPRGNASQYLIE